MGRLVWKQPELKMGRLGRGANPFFEKQIERSYALGGQCLRGAQQGVRLPRGDRKFNQLPYELAWVLSTIMGLILIYLSLLVRLRSMRPGPPHAWEFASLMLVALCLLGFVPKAQAAPVQSGDRVGTAIVTPALETASVRTYEKGSLRPQSGWLVLHLEGKPYERGVQHGQLLAREIAEYIRVLGRYHAPKDPDTGWKSVRLISSALFLRRFEPEFLEEMKGIADGAAAAGARVGDRKIDLLDIVAINTEIETSFLDEALDSTPIGLEGKQFQEPINRAPIPREEHCSAFVATGPATADGKVVIGHITMWNLFHSRFLNVWIDIQPEDGHRVIFQGYPGAIMSGTDFYMNDRGLAVVETTIDQTRFEPESRPLSVRVRRALQYGSSIDDIVAALSAGNNGLYTNEWLMADTNTNEIAMFELGTKDQKLWRSSKQEWFGGTEGFYWGCNNAKDLKVRLETVPSVLGTPVNVMFHPDDRDRAWLAWFDRYRGRIDLAAAQDAFTTPPLAAARSLDVKITTADLMGELSAVARFGPPRSESWRPTDAERALYPEIRALIPHDWTHLSVQKESRLTTEANSRAETIRLSPEDFPDGQVLGSAEEQEEDEGHPRHRPSWHGTLLPGTNQDLWLAAAFAAHERLVTLDRSEEPTQDPDVALFGYLSQYLAARARLGRDLPLSQIVPELRDDAWYDIALGKGVFVLETLRNQLGDEAYLRLMDEYGRAHAGKPADVADLIERSTAIEDGPTRAQWNAWLGPDALANLPSEVTDRLVAGRFWSVLSFEHNPESAVIIYGTKAEADAQREAAQRLQHAIRTRWSNITVPILADTEVMASGLPARHLLLVGRPATNHVSAQIETMYQKSQLVNRTWPVTFGPASFGLEGKSEADTAAGVIAAGPHPTDPAFSAVIFAGNSSAATWYLVEALPREARPELVVMPRRGPAVGYAIPLEEGAAADAGLPSKPE